MLTTYQVFCYWLQVFLAVQLRSTAFGEAKTKVNHRCVTLSSVVYLYGQTAFQPLLNSFSASQISLSAFLSASKPFRSAFLISHLWNQFFNILALQVFNTQIRSAFHFSVFSLFNFWAFPIFSFTAFLFFSFSAFPLFRFSAFRLFRFSAFQFLSHQTALARSPSVSQPSQLLQSATYLVYVT